jgi:hypothetical protein
VLFHTVGSKISGHAFDAHFNMLDLRFSHWHDNHRTEQNQ